tara:strand:+ start:331 stop:903 length:573 start_codon:yes stop_codon:yes gene_type:complete
MSEEISSVEKYLESLGKEFVKQAKKNLKRGGKGGGPLEASIKSKVVPIQNGFALEFYMADYGTFQDKGVKGKGGKIGDKSFGGRRWFIDYKGKRQDSPYKYGSGSGKKGGLRKGIASFIRKKGLQPRGEGGKYMSPKGLNFLISRSIYIKGLHGISFFQRALGVTMDKIEEGGLLKAIEEDVLNTLENKK